VPCTAAPVVVAAGWLCQLCVIPRQLLLSIAVPHEQPMLCPCSETWPLALTALTFGVPCVQRELEGLNVAYLDGPFDRSTFFSDPADQAPCCTSCTEQDAVLLRQQLRDTGGEVDLLLTREWPARVTEELPPGLVEAAGGWSAGVHPDTAEQAVSHQMSGCTPLLG
jgi:hypothetical protein